MLDYIVVGAGPAGLQMGHHLQERGRSYLIFEAGAVAGAFFAEYPRHRRMISINKRFNGFPEPDFNLRHDWNSLLTDDPDLQFTRYSTELFPAADDYCTYLQDFARKHALAVRHATRVTHICREQDGGFTVADDHGATHRARRVLMATGAVRPRIPAIPGIELAMGYEDHPLEQSFYENKRVAIIGRGNSAFEVADHIAAHAAVVHILVDRPVKHAWTTHYPGDLRAINNTILDMYELKSMHATLGLRPIELRRREDGRIEMTVEDDLPHWETPGTARATVVYDHVIRCTGWRYCDEALFDEDQLPAQTPGGKYPQLSCLWESSLEGLHWIGTAMAGRDRRAASGFIHGYRYNVRTLFHLLEEQLFDVPYPAECLPYGDAADLDGLAEALVARLSTTSALYQQFGVLCDALLLDGRTAIRRPELPVAWVHERSQLTQSEALVLIAFEYGFHKYDDTVQPLDFISPVDPGNPACTAFIHPVLRHYRRGRLASELHLNESLVVRFDTADYRELLPQRHRNRLKNFLNSIVEVTPERFPEHYVAPEAAATLFQPWSRRRREQLQTLAPRSQSECHFVSRATLEQLPDRADQASGVALSAIDGELSG
jgi:thioredoxin reductase